uniref:Uncharacterized protein n=1 Tax=Anser brachyrhynchus TaxID=132585 RepID=A0A8B9CMA4_9AVES
TTKAPKLSPVAVSLAYWGKRRTGPLPSKTTLSSWGGEGSFLPKLLQKLSQCYPSLGATQFGKLWPQQHCWQRSTFSRWQATHFPSHQHNSSRTLIQQDTDSAATCHGSTGTKQAKPQNSSFMGSPAPKGSISCLSVTEEVFSVSSFFFSL